MGQKNQADRFWFIIYVKTKYLLLSGTRQRHYHHNCPAMKLIDKYSLMVIWISLR